MGGGDAAVSLAVEVQSLVRDYARKRSAPRRALDGVSLTVASGSIHGLLGPNGAGKTTLCKILSTVLIPTSGHALVNGHDVLANAQEVRESIGIVFGGERGLYTRLTARQNLRYWSALYKQKSAVGSARTDALLTRFGLAERADDPVETFSRGMKQRLHLARGLIGDPSVLILDEPTTGMDPVAAHDFRSLIGELKAEGRTVLITTHDMAEAEAVCDEVTLIDSGRIVASANTREIGTWLSAYESVEARDVSAALVQQVRGMAGVTAVSEKAGSIVVETSELGVAASVLKILVNADVSSARLGRPTLEQVYLHLIGDRGMDTR